MKCPNCGETNYWRIDCFATADIEFDESGMIKWVDCGDELNPSMDCIFCGECGAYLHPKQAKNYWKRLAEGID